MKSQPKTSRPDQPGRPNSGKRSVPARRKRARALSPKQFVNILEHMKDGLVVPNKDRHYVYVSQKAAEMLQRQEPSDLVGKHIWTEWGSLSRWHMKKALKYIEEQSRKYFDPNVVQEFFRLISEDRRRL